MSRTVKITISMPEDRMEQIECERHVRSESRSQLVRAAVEQMLRERRQQANVERYIQAYQEHPVTDEEGATAARLGQSVWAETPWE